MTLHQLSQKYADIFQAKLSNIKGFKARLHLKDGAKPQFWRSCFMPFASWQGNQSPGEEQDSAPSGAQ